MHCTYVLKCVLALDVGEEMERMDFVMLAVDIISRWVDGDQCGMAGIPSGLEWLFPKRAVR